MHAEASFYMQRMVFNAQLEARVGASLQVFFKVHKRRQAPERCVIHVQGPAFGWLAVGPQRHPRLRKLGVDGQRQIRQQFSFLDVHERAAVMLYIKAKIGRASCRERVKMADGTEEAVDEKAGW